MAGGAVAPASSRITTLRSRAERLLEKRGSLLTLWQTLAEQFYPQRADFTTIRNLGDELTNHLATSYPMMVRRDLGNAFSAMLRPAGRKWFSLTTTDPFIERDVDARRWLDDAEDIQRRAMYDVASQFVRATKQGDHDFATFGNCVLSVEPNAELNGLSYRCWHLRDCAWAEGDDGRVDFFVRRWSPDARSLIRKFPKTVSQATRSTAEKDGERVVECLCIIVRTSEHETGGNKALERFPWTSIVIEKATGTVLEEIGQRTRRYFVPRWETVSGTQYAYSPATVAALPDGRLLQSMVATLLEAGERAVDPPMVATREVVRSDLQIFAGGVTWVDSEYDERLGAALRPLQERYDGIPLGIEMAQDARTMLAEAFFLNKLSLPPPADGEQMTAYEAGQRVTEYIRGALPLFEPMENDYNGELCEMTFDVIMGLNGFGPPDAIPEALRGADVKFKFQTPLQAAMDLAKVGQFQQAQALLANALQIDPAAADEFNTGAAFRDALSGAQVPAAWMRSTREKQALRDRREQVEREQALAAGGKVASEIARNFAAANKDIAQTPTV